MDLKLTCPTLECELEVLLTETATLSSHLPTAARQWTMPDTDGNEIESIEGC
jgi:hypothetical protein